jgi:predicted transcriptional regulator of viral defense system
VINRNELRFLKFYNTFRGFTVFSTYDIEKSFPAFDRKVLVAWQNKGYLQKIRNNWYCFTDRSYRETDLFLIANKIYSPSYVSLESALSYYQFIPEGVFRITSISTIKTNHFDTPIGYFDYRNVKPALFFGYRLIRQRESPLPAWYKMATPEKAVIDFLYLNPQYKDALDFEGLRFNWEEFSSKVDLEKMKNFLNYIHSTALTNRMKKFLALSHAESE